MPLIPSLPLLSHSPNLYSPSTFLSNLIRLLNVALFCSSLNLFYFCLLFLYLFLIDKFTFFTSEFLQFYMHAFFRHSEVYRIFYMIMNVIMNYDPGVFHAEKHRVSREFWSIMWASCLSKCMYVCQTFVHKICYLMCRSPLVVQIWSTQGTNPNMHRWYNYSCYIKDIDNRKVAVILLCWSTINRKIKHTAGIHFI